MANFWQGQKEDTKNIYWVGWKNMCKSKFRSGLGFKDLHTFNFTLLAKQGWRILRNENSFLHRIYNKAIYFSNSNFFYAKLEHDPFYPCRGIWEARL